MPRSFRTTFSGSVRAGMHGFIDGLCNFALSHMDQHRIHRVMAKHDLNVSRISDYYSALPYVPRLEQTKPRWMRPSQLEGVHVDFDTMRRTMKELVGAHWDEYIADMDYDRLRDMGLGPGYPWLDGALLYCMLRRAKPARYIEVGSGLSTAHAKQALQRNVADARPCAITCIEPNPTDSLKQLLLDKLRVEEVQDTPIEVFLELETGDVLFIDTTHVLKVDGDVPYLYLEVLPRLNPGVLVQIHDIQWPYNIPYPAELFIFDWYRTRWPVFWTEAMLLQAFLAFNREFSVTMSVPMLRHYQEDFLKQTIPNYDGMTPGDFRTMASSIWITRNGTESGEGPR